ncbi:MAG TPA: EamA family transporter [Candidatus Binatia bacterium]|jgi:drug/metabolite transporter (DMT)-like permease
MWNSIFLATFSAVLYGSADFFGGLATRRASVIPVMIFSQLAGLAALLLVLPLLPKATATVVDFSWGALGGCVLAIGLALLYHGLATGKMSVVAPVTAVLAVVVPALAGFAAGDRLSWLGWSGIALALAAIVLISQDGAPAGAPEERRSRGLGAAFLAGALLGAFLTALKQTEPASGLLPLIPARLSAVAVLALVALSRRPSFRAARSAAWLILAGGALDVSANVLYLLAARLGTLTVAATLASLYPASTIVLARLFLSERLRRIQIAGLVCAAVGVALIGAG